MSISEALENVPVAITDLYSQYRDTQDPAVGSRLTEELNLLFERAQKERDRLGFACDERRADHEKLVRDARNSLREAEVQITLLQDRSQRLQDGVDRSLAEVGRLQEQYGQHRDSCARTREQNREALQHLAADLPRARQIVETAQKSCEGGTPPELVECSLPQGFIVTFREVDIRKEVTKLSGASERLLALNLERSARGHGHSNMYASGAASLLEVKMEQTHRLRGKAQAGVGQLARARFRRSSAKLMKKLPKLLQSKVIPVNLCSRLLRPPTCPMLKDDLATFLGNIEDLSEELKVRAATEEKHCQESLEAYDGQVQTLKRQADNGNVEMVSALAERSEMEATRRQRRQQLLLLSQDKKSGLEECERDLGALSGALCGAKKLRNDAGLTGAFLGDCEVSEWVLDTCTSPCGTAGEQNMTRRVIKAPPEVLGKKCPVLEATRVCNAHPCPVDGKMGRWGPWSPCSRACGSGTRTRTRDVLVEPQHGGLPLAETMQEQICNTQPCDEECTLFPWTDWSSCSKACNGGHEARTRAVRQVALGDGTCPTEEDKERYEARPCNMEACSSSGPPKKCNATMDVVFALDSSGSAGKEGFAATTGFVKEVIGHMELGQKKVRPGIVTFADAAMETQVLTSEKAAVEGKLGALQWAEGSTNSGEALAVAQGMLERTGRLGARQVVVMITDGMPVSGYITSTVAKRLKGAGIRLMFVLVGPGLSKAAVKGWVSFPAEENMVKVDTYGALNATKVTELLVNLCP